MVSRPRDKVFGKLTTPKEYIIFSLERKISFGALTDLLQQFPKVYLWKLETGPSQGTEAQPSIYD